MPWARSEPNAPWSLKLNPLSDAAYRLRDVMIHWAVDNLSDGEIPPPSHRLAWQRIALGIRRPKVPASLLEELVDARVLIPLDGGGYAIHDFLKYQQSKQQVEAEREAARDRQARRRT